MSTATTLSEAKIPAATQHPYPANVTVMDHPLLRHKIGQLRRKETSTKDFRQLVEEISQMLFYEASRHLPLKAVPIETPICATYAETLDGHAPLLVPLLRAGLGMVNGVLLSLVPHARVGHIGLYRNEETLQPVQYYAKLCQDAHEREVFVLDPMLATGGSAHAALNLIKDCGCQSIHFLCIIASRQGLEFLSKQHPDVPIYVGAVDEAPLNEHGYIVPGLGDAGDRIYGTK